MANTRNVLVFVLASLLVMSIITESVAKTIKYENGVLLGYILARHNQPRHL